MSDTHSHTGYDIGQVWASGLTWNGLGNTLTLHKAICAIRMVRDGMNEPKQCKPLNNTNLCNSQQRISCVSLTQCPKCELLIEVMSPPGEFSGPRGPGLPKTPHSPLGQSSDSHPVPLVHASPWVGSSCSSGSVLESAAHTETRKPGEQGAALFPCKDIRMRPQLLSDLLLYQELKQTREDVRRAGVQLLHCGGQPPALLC